MVLIATRVSAPGAAPFWGYDLHTHLAGKVTSNVLYDVLRRWEKLGLLTSEWETPGQSGRAPRRCYHLTEQGRAELAQYLTAARRQPRFAHLFTT